MTGTGGAVYGLAGVAGAGIGAGIGIGVGIGFDQADPGQAVATDIDDLLTDFVE